MRTRGHSISVELAITLNFTLFFPIEHCHAYSALGGFLALMRYMNSRFTYLLFLDDWQVCAHPRCA